MAETDFEKALSQMEGIVEKLESGELSLEESLKRFEEGMKLAQTLGKRLEDASRKVEILLKDPEGGSKREEFQGLGESQPSEVDGDKDGSRGPKARKARKGAHDQNSLF